MSEPLIKPTPALLLERVIKSEPIDRSAAMVTSFGWHFTYDKKHMAGVNHSEVPLPMREPHSHIERALMGRKFGRFTVLGLFALVLDKTVYVCRCTCGRYETRRSRAVRNPKNDIDCCDHCRYLIHLKTKQHYWSTGQYVTDKDFA